MRAVLTVGHSTRTLREFLELVRSSGVDRVADVRRFARSRRNPQFDAGVLAAALEETGIGYTHLPALGGRRRPREDSPNTGWRNLSFRGYADHLKTVEFREDFGRLVELCEREAVCLMCAEAVPWRCHRRIISDALLLCGFAVEHIISESSRREHTLTPWAEVVDGTELVYPGEG
jgi:uncharacterized protein (DUF488 family)